MDRGRARPLWPLLWLLVLACGMLACTGRKRPPMTEPASTPPPPGAAPGDLVMDQDLFRYAGHELRFLQPLSRWIEAFGPPSRRQEPDSVDHIGVAIWDHLGIAVYAREDPDGRADVNRFEVQLMSVDDPRLLPSLRDSRKQQDAFTPRGGFPGRFFLQGAELARGPNETDVVGSRIKNGTFAAGRIGTWGYRDTTISARSPGGTGVHGSARVYCDLPPDHPGRHRNVFSDLTFAPG